MLRLAAGSTALAVGALVGLPQVARAEVPSGWGQAATDSFSRDLGNGWGSAPTGGAYSLSGSGSTKVSGSEGLISPKAGQTVTAQLKSVSAGDVDVSDTVRFSGGGSDFSVLHGWSARIQSDGSAYSARVRANNAGQATLGVSRVLGRTATWLTGASLPFSLSAGDNLRGEFQITGTSPVQLKLRVWKEGSAIPAWQVQYADTTSTRISAKGSVAVFDRVHAATSAVTFAHDDLSVGVNSGAAPVPPAPVPPAPVPPAPVPPAPVPPTSGRGALPIGSASYAIPAGAVFVDLARGNDGNSGSSASPKKTIAAGAARAASGGTVVVRAGVYHESVSVASNKTITIQNYPNEAVWLDGSILVRNWVKSGNAWVATGWTKEFSNTMGSDAAFKARFIGSNPMAADPDQVFVNGTALRQVGSAGAVTAGTFYVNDGSNTLTIGSDPAGKEVRASDLAQAVNVSGPNSVVQGIGIRRFANGYEVPGALRVGGTGGTIRNVVVQDVASVGISISGIRKKLDRVTVQRAGMLGVGGHRSDDSFVTNSVISGNNTEKFKDAPVAGGVKITAARTFTIKNIEANDNGGSGIWFDVSCYNLTIVNSTANDNSKNGITVEVSDLGIVANNVTINDGEKGMVLLNSGNFKVFNNEFGGGSLFGLKLAQDERRQAQLGEFSAARDTRVSGVDPTVPWITRNIQLSNNAFGGGGRFQVYALDGRTKRAVDSWNVTINGNLFTKRVASSDPTMVAWGKADNVTLDRYETPAALAAAKNSSWKNAQTSGLTRIETMEDEMLSYASVAVPVPNDVAGATGLPAGARIIGAR